jgi:16S rRNA (cytosine967-C5)-methyltransferase
MSDSPRKIALDVLIRVRRDKAYASIVLDSEQRKARLSEPDSGLLTELVYGVLRNRMLLDFYLDHVSKKSITKTEPRVLDILRLGAYQLLFLDRVPDHAAVNETVGMTPRRASGFVNALMRKLIGLRDALPEPTDSDPLDALSITTSHPRWIIDKYAERFGAEGVSALCERNQTPLPYVLRTNGLLTTRDQLIEKLEAEGVQATPAKYAKNGVVVHKLGRALLSDAFAQGLFVVQGEAGQLAVELLDPQPGEKILDTCAAPGIKTIQIAEAVGENGQVIAVDVIRNRLTKVEQNAKLVGATNIRCVTADMTRKPPGRIGQDFDRVLVDAPCSALGELGKYPEARYQREPESIVSLVTIQRQILQTAAKLVGFGKVLVYSTCSLTIDENEDVIRWFLERHPDFTLQNAGEVLGTNRETFITEKGMYLAAPHTTETAGFFAARLVRQKP